MTTTLPLGFVVHLHSVGHSSGADIVVHRQRRCLASGADCRQTEKCRAIMAETLKDATAKDSHGADPDLTQMVTHVCPRRYGG